VCASRIYSTNSRGLVAKHWYKDCRPQTNTVPVNIVHCVLFKTVFVVRVPTTRVINSVSKGWLIINIILRITWKRVAMA
jgi:hypothetical protein